MATRKTDGSTSIAPFSAIACSLALCALSVASPRAAQKTTGVGSVSATVGAAATAAREESRPTGAKLEDATIAQVDLLDNDLNPCVDGGADCRVYLVAETAADPEIAYDGRAMKVGYPMLMNVVLVPENDPDLHMCLIGQRPIEWEDVVELGRTVAKVESGNLKTMVEWARTPPAAPARYRMVWCPLPAAGISSRDMKPMGQSWRLQVRAKQD